MQPSPATMAHWRTELDALFAPANRSDAPGLVVGIALGGEVIYRRGFGLASVQHGVANTPATRVRIASASKHFTSLAVLLLAEDGLIDIDAPLGRCLPGLSAADGAPSARQYMNHTSGVRCTLEMGTVANGYATQPADWQWRALQRQSAANFSPGRDQIYCNGSYHVLSLLIERLAGMPFERFLKTRIFEPLSLHQTDSVADDTLLLPGLASPHVPAAGGGWQRPPSDTALRGDGGIVSTVDDLLRWLAHLRSPQRIVGSARSWDTLLGPAVLANGCRSTYALGIKRHAWRGVDVIHHSGGLLGLNAQLLTVPAHALDIAIAVNGAPLSATLLARQVVEIVLGAALQPALQPTPSQAHAHLIGTRYQGDDGLLLGFADIGGRLGLRIMNMPPAPVLFDDGDGDGDKVRASFEDIGLGPYVWRRSDLGAGANGTAPAELALTVAGSKQTLRLLKPPSPGTTPAVPFGCYACADLDAVADVVHGGDGGTAHLQIKGDYAAQRGFTLEAWSDTVFGAVGLPPSDERYAVTFDAAGAAASGFWIDTYRARRLWFARLAR